jgi:hypothetical protein
VGANNITEMERETLDITALRVNSLAVATLIQKSGVGRVKISSMTCPTLISGSKVTALQTFG